MSKEELIKSWKQEKSTPPKEIIFNRFEWEKIVNHVEWQNKKIAELEKKIEILVVQ